jgi:peptidoglycan/xylan/chitin deacetylase (PgdA/CDA1 family)
VDKFEAQLRMIRDEAEIVPLMELLTTDAPNDRRVAITFDDAYASALDLGVGACVSANAPCTVFVAPGLLGTVPVWDRAADAGQWTDADRNQFLWTQRGTASSSDGASFLTASNPQCEIGTMDSLLAVARQRLVTFGNHTMTHPNLGALSPAEASSEIERASSWLDEHLRYSSIPVAAYPYGIPPAEWDGGRLAAVVSRGLLVSGGWLGTTAPMSPLGIPRWNVPAGVSSAGFLRRLRGWM